MKDLGVATFLLGIELRRKEGGDMLMAQEKYALEVVQKFGMVDSKEVSTPFEPGSILGVEDVTKSNMFKAMVTNFAHRALEIALPKVCPRYVEGTT